MAQRPRSKVNSTGESLPAETLVNARRFPLLEWLLIFGFVTLLWLPTVDYFGGIDHTRPPGENRLPAPPPRLARLDFSGVQSYLAAAETYFNDHFGFRKRLIRWFQRWKMGIYHDRSVNKVVLGKDGWLFTSEERMVEHYVGIVRFAPQELRDWQRLLEKRRDWLAQRGIKYLFVISPDKQTIYPEQLPAWLLKAAPTNHETKLDQLLRYMKENSTVEIQDLRPPLIAAKKTAPTYLVTDEHWNLFGGFVAAQEIIKTMSRWLPDLPPLRSEDYIWTNAPAGGGNMARLLGSDAGEKNSFQFSPVPVLPVLRTNENPGFKSNWGPKRVFFLENPTALRRNVVVFHDSFGAAWQPFFGQCFKRSVFEWEAHDFNTALISSNSPDVVVNEILERYVNTLDPNEMMARDALP